MKKILIFILCLPVLGLSGCKNYLDINGNPNQAVNVSIDQLMAGGFGYTAAYMGYEVALLSTIWAQYGTQASNTNQYRTIMENNLNYGETYFTRPWRYALTYAVPSFMEVQARAEESEDDLLVQEVIAKTMLAYNLQIINSCYDQMPFDELNEGLANTEPVFETGQEVYAKIMAILEDVLTYNLTELDEALYHNPVSSADYVFGGKPESWLKFANTLYLKWLLRDPAANSSKITTALSSGIGFLDAASGDAKMDIFLDEPNKSYPLYESDRRQLNTAYNILGTDGLTQFFKTNNDPRLDYYIDNTNGRSGAVFGSASANTSYDRMSLGATDPVYLASVAEAYFLQAEAYARLGNTSAAKSNYDDGVLAAFARWGEDGSSFIASGGAYEFDATATTEAMIEQIIDQKYVASFRSQQVESWFDINRTGYPVRSNSGLINTYNGTLASGYPVRYLYPKDSRDYNKNTPDEEPLNAKMWWHK